jgi:hypothetical protein
VRVVSRVAVLLRKRRHVSFAHVVAHRSWVSSCRAVSARDNKLFSLINTRVDNGNSSGHIF